MRRFTYAVVMAAMLVFVAGCQSAGETISEGIIENIDGVDDVEIDEDSGEVRLETEDGSFSFGGGEVPDDLEIAVPDGGDVLVTFDAPDGISVSFEFDIDSFDSVVEFYESWVASDPGEWQSNSASFDSGEGVALKSETWIGDGRSIHVTTCPSSQDTSDDGRATCVTLIQEK